MGNQGDAICRVELKRRVTASPVVKRRYRNEGLVRRVVRRTESPTITDRTEGSASYGLIRYIYIIYISIGHRKTGNFFLKKEKEKKRSKRKE